METNTTTNNTPTFRLAMSIQSDNKVYAFDFYTEFLTEEEREAFVATMPKSLKPKTYMRCGFHIEKKYAVQVTASLSSTKNNTKNETGIKRFRKFVELYSSQIVCQAFYTNAVKTLEEAIAYVDARDAE
jgi:hypothetical protein